MDDLGDASDDDEKNITSVLETVEGCSVNQKSRFPYSKKNLKIFQ